MKLLLAEFLGLLPLCWRDWTGTGCRRRPQLRGWPYLGPCCGRLVAALEAQTGQHAADRVTTAPETARNLRRALSCGPELFEKRYVFPIPAHGRYYSADCQTQASLVFVRLAHDRGFVSIIFLIVVFALLVFIGIPGRQYDDERASNRKPHVCSLAGRLFERLTDPFGGAGVENGCDPAV